MVNRLWARYFGRGLVEPLDDLRETNPPTNPELLDALAQHLIDQNFDLKAVTRTLLNSRVYQLTSDANEFNIHDRQNFSHAQYRAMPAEVLLDAISQPRRRALALAPAAPRELHLAPRMRHLAHDASLRFAFAFGG